MSTNRHFFDNSHAEVLLQRWQATGDTRLLDELLRHATPLIQAIGYHQNTTNYIEPAELLSLVQAKLVRTLPQFDPSRSPLHSFISLVTESLSRSLVTEYRTHTQRYPPLDPEFAKRLPAPANNHHPDALTEITARIRQTRTPHTGREAQAQRQLINLWLASGFELPRHTAANAISKTFNLDRTTARRLHDLTLLEVRRALLNEHPPKTTAPLSLLHTRSQYLIPYAKLLPPPDFSKLTLLLTNLPSTTLIWIRPENRTQFRLGNPHAIRQNLEAALHGNPNNLPLF